MAPPTVRRSLEPITLGPVEARNRVVVTGHGAFLDFYRPGEPADRYVGYLERRAAGGVGTIILQPIHVHPSSHALGHYVYDPDDMRRKFALMAEALHRHGTVALVQVFHFGAQFTSDARTGLQPLWAFSPVTSPEGEVAHEMTDAEVEEIVEAFGRTAELACEAGLDGVELHAAHGYLVQQSFSPWANQRTDRWGEPLAFALATLERIRRGIGDDKVLGLRISADDWVPVERGGLGPEGLRQVAAALVGTGQLDYLNHSAGARAAHYARAVGSYRYDHGHLLGLTRGLREAIGARVPVVGVGRIVDLDEADEAIASGACDLVAMTRAHIADPDVVAKALEGRVARPCVGAQQGCVDRMVGGLPITCFHNPDVGRERAVEVQLRRSDRPRRILVVGAGPAGLKAAEAAARRGHLVTVADVCEEPGGRLRYVRRLGRAAELARSIDWLVDELHDLGVTLELGRRVDLADLAGADATVLATGARTDESRLCPTDETVPLFTTTGLLDRIDELDLDGRPVLVVDTVGSQEVALTAEALAERGARLTVATPGLSPGWAVGFTLLKDVLQRIHDLGGRFETSTVVTGIEHGEVHTRHSYARTTQRRPFDLVLAGIPPVADRSLLDAALRHGHHVHPAGDAVAPRTAMHAFREGQDVGAAL